MSRKKTAYETAEERQSKRRDPERRELSSHDRENRHTERGGERDVEHDAGQRHGGIPAERFSDARAEQVRGDDVEWPRCGAAPLAERDQGASGCAGGEESRGCAGSEFVAIHVGKENGEWGMGNGESGIGNRESGAHKV